MNWIDLGNPIPRSIPIRYTPMEWDTGEIHPLPALSTRLLPRLNQVLDNRFSVREFSALNDQQLGEFLWHACRTRDSHPSGLGFRLEHRASPSAGAIHPIHVILKIPNDSRWWLYCPQNHELVEIKKAEDKLAALYKQSLDVLNGSEATRILFLAEPGKTLGKYQEGCSLLWRDAGALLGVMALTASALSLNFCPLGITGEPWASSLSDQRELVGVGLALLGTASSS